METERLYYIDAYQRQFSARVVSRRVIDQRPAAALDRTAFYPTGGGQPHDTGTLNGVPVLDVREVDGQVWHLLGDELRSDRVDGQIDWPRRWDHMQNHSGQHVLSQAFLQTAEAETVAWHLSGGSVTIDLDQARLDDDALAAAEGLANAVVQENRAITSYLAAEAELTTLDLRKRPPVDGALRIVEVAGFDRVACSGTHVSTTAQIGLIKVLRAERRGGETRVHFVCGGRALADYTRKHGWVRSLATKFGRSEEELLDAVDKLQAEAQANHKALRQAQEALVNAEAERLWAAVANEPAPRLVSGLYVEWPADQVKRLAVTLRSRPGCFVALAGGSPPQVFFGRSDDLALDAGQALRTALATAGGRGGGRSEFAQGSVPSPEAAAQVLALASTVSRKP